MAKNNFSNEFTYKKFIEEGKEAEFDRLFDEAVQKAKQGFGSTYHMYIGGKEVDAGSVLTERSPIDGAIIGYFQKGTREHARMAIAAAKDEFARWRQVDYKERARIFRKFADVLAANKFDVAAILSLENGKSRYESIGEVDEGIDFSRYYAGELEANKGYARKTSLEESRQKVSAGFQGAPSNAEKVSIVMKPYGVFGVIAPFNFPISISIGMSIGAMITGNTVVFKPSSSDNMTMLTGFKIYQLLKEAGLPDGVFNYITGPGSEVGDELVVNTGVSGIVFTGS
ncbi:MAG: aldehyde dehydrogenase family protein, partial [Candidatus Micrarchaeaceae archaeon]